MRVPSLLRRSALVALALPASLCQATDVVTLSDGSVYQYGDKSDAPYIAQWTNGAWAPIALPAKLLPAKGSFEALGSDPQGNLYLTYEDASNEKKKAYGALARVDGAWSRLGALPKNWETGGHITARSPREVYLDVRLIKERSRLVAKWDGATFTELALPAGAEGVEGLRVHDGMVVLLVDGKGPSGTYRDGSIVYHLEGGGAWAPMGPPCEGSADLLLTVAPGVLWRLGSVAEYWDGMAWQQGFTFPNSSLDGYRIARACSGAEGDLYVVLTDKDNDDHLARATRTRGLSWYKGNEQTSKFEYGLYDPFLDADGALRLTMSGQALRFTKADFSFGSDGYPEKDEMARAVHLAYKATVPTFNSFSRQLVHLDSVMSATAAKADVQAYKDKAQEAMVWCTATMDQLQALNVGPKRNRLHDALLEFLQLFHDQLYLNYRASEALLDGQLDEAQMQRWSRSYTAMQIAFNNLKQEEADYPRRNGLE
ncbi:MAG: hypothetical protein KDC02_20900 [Flavobacteriales bacterium]|nr:hypothetical protein [Flavobacteriales bacterium]